jgi:hypothetical protein
MKNMCILKLLLNIATAGIQVPACLKEVCHLRAQPHFDTFHQLIIVEVLCSQPVLQVGKQVVVTQARSGL